MKTVEQAVQKNLMQKVKMTKKTSQAQDLVQDLVQVQVKNIATTTRQ